MFTLAVPAPEKAPLARPSSDCAVLSFSIVYFVLEEELSKSDVFTFLGNLQTRSSKPTRRPLTGP